MSRDDMVIRPRLGSNSEASTPVAERREAQPGGRAGVSPIGLGAGLRRFGLGLGLIRGGVVSAAAVAAAIAAVMVIHRQTGRTLEGLGEELRQGAFDGLDDDAIAAREAKEQLMARDDIMRIVGGEGRVNAQVAALFDYHKATALRRRKGRTLIMGDARFDVDGMMDLIARRCTEKVEQTIDALTKKEGG